MKIEKKKQFVTYIFFLKETEKSATTFFSQIHYFKITYFKNKMSLNKVTPSDFTGKMTTTVTGGK